MVGRIFLVPAVASDSAETRSVCNRNYQLRQKLKTVFNQQ
jgi:hypothetical protein